MPQRHADRMEAKLSMFRNEMEVSGQLCVSVTRKRRMINSWAISKRIHCPAYANFTDVTLIVNEE
jgi:hypothetical protein